MEQSDKNGLERELEMLQTLRDELKLKVHLAAADVRDEFHRLEKKWERLDEELHRTARHAKLPLQAVGAQSRELIEELQRSYSNIRRLLLDSVAER